MSRGAIVANVFDLARDSRRSCTNACREARAGDGDWKKCRCGAHEYNGKLDVAMKATEQRWRLTESSRKWNEARKRRIFKDAGQ